MYAKKILILQQTDPRFAQAGKELCGMVKVENSHETTVTLFVTNADLATFGQWWLLIAFGNKQFARNLTTLNNEVFSLPLQNCEDISCLLVKQEDKVFEVAQAQLGLHNYCGSLRRNMSTLIGEKQTSPYLQFVGSAKDLSSDADVQKLRTQADARYKTVQDYSAAFERFYASGGNTDYYQSVHRELSKVFLQFPPYYPLIRHYPQSFFVRVDFPLSDRFFVVGVLQQNGQVQYICYGLPAEQSHLEDNDFVFVECPPTNFWMLFQDAATGRITTPDCSFAV